VAQLEKKLADLGLGEISTLSGRYYAMDRDKRWERVQLAYDVMCRAAGQCEKPEGTLADFVTAKHAAGETDEFVKPVGVLADGGIADGDTFMCYNYRSDRAREMFEAISTEPAFETAVKRTPAQCFSFTQYSSAFTSLQIFPPQKLKNGAASLQPQPQPSPSTPPCPSPSPSPQPPTPARTLTPALTPSRPLRVDLRAGPHPVPRGRDREVRARDLLLQRCAASG